MIERHLFCWILPIARRGVYGLRHGLLCLILTTCGWPLVSVNAQADERIQFAEAKEHLQRGRYDEAIEAFDALVSVAAKSEQATDDDVFRGAICGWAQALVETGKPAEADDVLKLGLAKLRDAPALLGARARLAFRRGDWKLAEQCVAATLAVNAEDPCARYVQAQLLFERGEVAKAEEAFRWFVRYYNRKQPKDAETLLVVAEGSAEYARLKHVPQIFGFALNTLAVDSLKADKLFWQASVFSGNLLLEKSNVTQAAGEYRKALAINSQCAAAYAGLAQIAASEFDFDLAVEQADAALAIAPDCREALLVKIDTAFFNRELPAAREALLAAESSHGHLQTVLARRAGYDLLAGKFPAAAEWKTVSEEILANTTPSATDDSGKPESGLAGAVNPLRQLVARRANPAVFLTTLGEIAEQAKEYEFAEICHHQADRLIPALAGPKIRLGLLAARRADRVSAKKWLDAAYAADPFDLRVSNLRKVEKVLDDYTTLSTDHFVFRYDRGQDQLFVEQLAEFMEQDVYPQLTAAFGFESEARTPIEIYSKAKGLSGHQWFSARLTGFPWIQTIGASTGAMIAAVSPSATPKPYNWARVFRHEFVHVLNLQQTRYQIPHWYTEALAVKSEQGTRPQIWNQLLYERVPKRDLRNLGNLDEGFTRSKSIADWNFAYCQSDLYAQYFERRFGPDALRRLLEGYSRGETTEQILNGTFGMTLFRFEGGYVSFLDSVVADLRDVVREVDTSAVEVEAYYKADPSNPLRALAYIRLLAAEQRVDEGELIARQILEQQPQASGVAAWLAIALSARGEDAAAEQFLERARAGGDLDWSITSGLMAVYAKRGDWAQVCSLLDPWIGRSGVSSLSRMELLLKASRETQNKEIETRVLRELERLDFDNPQYPLDLARLAVARSDFHDVVASAQRVLYIDVRSADAYELLGLGRLRTGDSVRGLLAVQQAYALVPTEPRYQIALVRGLAAAGEVAEATKKLDEFRAASPSAARWAELAAEIAPGR